MEPGAPSQPARGDVREKARAFRYPGLRHIRGAAAGSPPAADQAPSEGSPRRADGAPNSVAVLVSTTTPIWPSGERSRAKANAGRFPSWPTTLRPSKSCRKCQPIPAILGSGLNWGDHICVSVLLPQDRFFVPNRLEGAPRHRSHVGHRGTDRPRPKQAAVIATDGQQPPLPAAVAGRHVTRQRIGSQEVGPRHPERVEDAVACTRAGRCRRGRAGLTTFGPGCGGHGRRVGGAGCWTTRERRCWRGVGRAPRRCAASTVP
jgi:hypothetical protein